MTILDLPNFLCITVVAVIVDTLFCTHVLNKWFAAAILIFVILAIAAFLIPNFENITYEPLLGFAAFMPVLSLIMSFLIWYSTRDFRRKRREKKALKEMKKRGISPEEEAHEFKRRK